MIDIDILKKAQTEDVTDKIQSFDKLVADHEGKIFNTIYSFIGDYDDAMDLTQETFICAFRNISKFRQESSMSTWLYTIAINICKKNYKKKKKLSSIFIDSVDNPQININSIEQINQDQSIEDMLEIDEKQDLIQQEISSLPKKYRTVIILKYLQDLSYEEIAKIVGCNVGTVKSRLSRAKDKLKPKLKRLMEVEI
jgi:RNA polymerase sigma-70 factor (ECF subfamily)